MQDGRRTIVFYLPNLAGGGVERVQLLLASNFMDQGYRVIFALHSATGELAAHVPQEARVIDLHAPRCRSAFMPLVGVLRREKPDILLSALGHNNIVALLAGWLAGRKTAVIVSQHNALSAEEVRGRGLKFSKLLPLLYRFFLRRADGIVAVSQGIADELAMLARVDPSRITVIYNPVITRAFQAKKDEACPHPWLQGKEPPVILGVGRLVELKDFATLIEAFAKVKKTRDARLVLVGDGPLLETLEHQAEALGVSDATAFVRFQANPFPYMRQASLVVLPSLYEGFGNVLVEALACGTPVVATRCPFGPPEILGNGRWGKIVPVGDSEALAKAMIGTLASPPHPARLRSRGLEFTEERSVNAYLRLFDNVLEPRAQRAVLPAM